MKNIIPLILILTLLSGCATITGPYVSQEEIILAQEELKVKALGYQLQQLERVNNIGYRLISALPKEDFKKEPQAYLGIYVFKIDKYLKQLYNFTEDRGCVIGLVIKNSPAEKAGIKTGDVLLSLDNARIDNVNDFYAFRKQLDVGQTVTFKISRMGRTEIIYVRTGFIPLNIPIVMVDLQEVNAAAGNDGIFVTYGLIHFAKSEDEIAAVLGHELAHIVRGHLIKAQGTQIISALAAIALGIVAENASPGSGEAVMRGVGGMADIFNARYSRDLEREADYFGTKYVYLAGFDVDFCATFEERFAIEIPQSMIRNYLSTHPSSPERMLRIKKTIAELKTQGKPKF